MEDDLAHVVLSEEPDGHDSLILPLGHDLGPMLPQFTPAAPVPEEVIIVPPPLTKSQRKWKRHSGKRPAPELASGANADLAEASAPRV